MKVTDFTRNLLLTTVLAAGISLPAQADDMETDADVAVFQDTDLLVTTLMRDDEAEVTAAELELNESLAAEAAAQAALDAAETEEEIVLAQAELDAAVEARLSAEEELFARQAEYDEEYDLVMEQVDDLSDDQVFAFNRSLNNTRHNGRIPNLDSEQIAMALDDGYDAQDINALTKAYEEEVKFDSFAARFEERAEVSGNDKFLENAERMSEKADSQRDKFLARIDGDAGEMDVEESIEAEVQSETAVRLGADDAREVADETASEARLEARGAAQEARESAREASQEARESARDAAHEARETARDAAQDARETARDVAQEARETARDAAQEARETARDAAQEARDVAREAKDVAKEAAQDVRQDAREIAREARQEARDIGRNAARGL